MLGLKLADVCAHCGEELVVFFRRDMVNDGDLQAAVSHGRFQSSLIWMPVSGLDDALRIDSGPETV